MNVQRPVSTLLLPGLIASFCFASVTCHGQTIPIDNFDDCNDDGWTHEFHIIGNTLADLHPAPGGTWDASFMQNGSCAYRMAAAEAPISAILATWDGSTDRLFSNGFFRATVRPETQESGIIMGMRAEYGAGFIPGSTLTGPANQGEIFLHNDTMRIREHAVGDESIVGGELDIHANEDWFMQIGTVEDLFSLKAWRVGEPEPVSPQLTATYEFTSTGKLLLGTGVPPGGPGGIGSVVFDDLVFIVPEPSTVLLGALGLLVLPALARRRVRQLPTPRSRCN